MTLLKGGENSVTKEIGSYEHVRRKAFGEKQAHQKDTESHP